MPLLSVLNNGNRIAVNNHLALFKERGNVSFNKVLQIPKAERIPLLVEKPEGRAAVLIALTAAIGSALKNISVKQGMDENQIVDLAEMIIDQSFEDYIGIEDVLLFLQGLLLGKYGTLYERFDIPKFFEKFEIYRQERHDEYRRVQDEMHTQSKISGAGNEKRPDTKVHGEDAEALFDLMQTYNESKNDKS